MGSTLALGIIGEDVSWFEGSGMTWFEGPGVGSLARIIGVLRLGSGESGAGVASLVRGIEYGSGVCCRDISLWIDIVEEFSEDEPVE